MPFISFWIVFTRKNWHNILAMMLDPKFKNMWLINSYAGQKRPTILVVEYGEQVVAPFVCKMLQTIDAYCNWRTSNGKHYNWLWWYFSQHPNNWKQIVSREVDSFWHYPIDAYCKCALNWWHIRDKLFTIASWQHNFLAFWQTKCRLNRLLRG